jgi:hypothetical protein
LADGESILRLLTTTFGLVTALSSITLPVVAQMAAPQVIDAPVKAEWRDSLEQFLRDFGANEPSALVKKTAAFMIGGLHFPDSILFRIEDQETCAGDSCLTVIGRIVGDRFHADAMFVAGNRYTQGDHAVTVLGLQTFPLYLIGNALTVTLLETPSGWLVVSAPSQK